MLEGSISDLGTSRCVALARGMAGLPDVASKDRFNSSVPFAHPAKGKTMYNAFSGLSLAVLLVSGVGAASAQQRPQPTVRIGFVIDGPWERARLTTLRHRVCAVQVPCICLVKRNTTAARHVATADTVPGAQAKHSSGTCEA